jgi:prepilin-type N-terminal cleavage/methylation domain-containing protein
MIFHKLRSISENQKGFTLIEIIATLAITSLIGVGAAMAIVQVVDQGSRNSDYTTASRNTLNAIHWISRDAQMAQTVEPNGSSGFPLNLRWVEWDSTTHQVTYTESEDTLRRSYSINGGAPSETLVAQYINWAPENTTCNVTGNLFTVQVTATVGTGTKAVSVAKVREITPRPGL